MSGPETTAEITRPKEISVPYGEYVALISIVATARTYLAMSYDTAYWRDQLARDVIAYHDTYGWARNTVAVNDIARIRARFAGVEGAKPPGSEATTGDQS